MTEETLITKLKALAEPGYRAFSGRLLPPQQAEKLLGVRLPQLRKIAWEIARGDWRSFLRECPDNYFEETMLQGMVIGCAAKEPAEAILYSKAFLPKIDNWSVCDSFCAGLKLARKYPQQMWDFVAPCVTAEGEFTARFGLVMLLDHFAEEAYAPRAFSLLDRMHSSGYYAKMAAAWAVSVYYVHCPQMTEAYLDCSQLDDFTYNKALQKITESYRVTPAQKAAVRARKRG